MTDQTGDSHSIAIIGMAGRFPGAKNVDELWQLLKSGRHAVSRPSAAELEAAGVTSAFTGHPNYVNACVKLDAYDRFDAEFFGYSPLQATSLDPQGRLFLECVWEGLEHAGYDPTSYDGVIGIFAGSGANHYLERYRDEIVELNAGNHHQTSLDGDKDFLTMRASYKLGLNGPSMAVQSACSSSLVAVHLACQSLLTFESDVVLAGGVSIKLNQSYGYLYEEGGIASRDGNCRPYDADASGTIGGSGCGVVVLKRLDEAIRDGDEIHAVIRSTAVNNDGADKAGFSAPGIKAQTQLIASAMAFAKLTPTDIGMVEGHGTGTVLGDAVELTALNESFGASQSGQRWCALGSIKSNIGHLDTASGVTGLIKAVLCLKNKHFVPTLHFAKPNPALETPGNPFFVNTEYVPWPDHGKPRRAGVSSFGMGGTNAHVIVEEAPARGAGPGGDASQLFLLSAHTGEALQQLSAELASYIEARPQLDLAKMAYTLQIGRRRLAHRRVVVATTREELIRALREAPSDAQAVHDSHLNRPVIFMFPGQGSQRSGAVQSIYDSEPFFRARIDECADLFKVHLGIDVRPFICQAEDVESASAINATLITQPAVFTVGYSLARLWMHWGVTPAGLLGHSVGEYIAACISGVLPLPDCVKLLAARARLVDAQPGGAMLAVRRSMDECRPWLKNSLSIAAINSASQCVISGASEDIDEAAGMLAAADIEHHRLPVSHAFHSSMMDQAMQGLEQAAQGCRHGSPRLPYISCVTGKPVRESDAIGPQYWARHLREPVNFQAALTSATTGGATILLEVGSGHALCSLARQQFGASPDYAYVGSLASHGKSGRTDLLSKLGSLWSLGANIDWNLFHGGTPPGRIGLVAYPFQRQRYWVKPFEKSEGRHSTRQRPLLAQDRAGDIKVQPDGVAAANEWTGLEAQVAGFWQEVLGIPSIRRTDTFMSLGGDSLIALRVIARIDDEFGVKISTRVLISATGTVEEVTRELVAKLADGLSAGEMSEYMSGLDAVVSDSESSVTE